MYLKTNGFTTAANGKVYHHGGDDVNAWSGGFVWSPKGTWSGISYFRPENRALADASGPSGRGPYFEYGPDDESLYPDSVTAEKTVADLRKLSESDNRFFLAAGFLRPHLPFAVPKRYWDMYEANRLPFPVLESPPIGAPAEAMRGASDELRNYTDVPKTGPFGRSMERKIIHGYHASVSFMDAQVGRVLAEIERLGLFQDTLIILTADHGWNLGEHGYFCKHCLFESALHVPTMFRGPGVKMSGAVDAVTEHVDLFPTVCDALGLQMPRHLEGSTLWPTLTAGCVPRKNHAISRWKDGWSVKTPTHRYTRWQDSKGRTVAEMLFNHTADPGERVNVADEPSQRTILVELATLLDAEKLRWHG